MQRNAHNNWNNKKNQRDGWDVNIARCESARKRLDARMVITSLLTEEKNSRIKPDCKFSIHTSARECFRSVRLTPPQWECV